MNAAMFISSLKYLAKRYVTISKLSNWTREILVSISYSEQKLKKCLRNKDLDAVRSIICFNKDRTVLEPFICKNYARISYTSVSHETKLTMLRFLKVIYGMTSCRYYVYKFFRLGCIRDNYELVHFFITELNVFEESQLVQVCATCSENIIKLLAPLCHKTILYEAFDNVLKRFAPEHDVVKLFFSLGITIDIDNCLIDCLKYNIMDKNNFSSWIDWIYKMDPVKIIKLMKEAISYDNEYIVLLIIEKNIVNLKQNDNDFVRTAFIKEAKYKMIKILLDNGADPVGYQDDQFFPNIKIKRLYQRYLEASE